MKKNYKTFTKSEKNEQKQGKAKLNIKINIWESEK